MPDSSKEGSGVAQSPDVQFREIDGEFLKQQARIWLEAVLNERFDSEISLADVLVDGEILLRVSTMIQSLLRKHADDGEPVSPKPMFPEASFYGKHGGKYLPYSNVDAFLKVCQKLGLTGVDLFSPPDVVEKKDIRRVCLCIRTLSKKARARHLEVPEFDYVTHSTVSMPTEFVGGIRNSLKQASTASSSPSLRDKEALDKMGLSPLRMKNSASSLSIGQGEPSTPDFSQQVEKEPTRSLNFDECEDTESAGQQQSVIDPDTPPMMEEDSGFSSRSRSGAVSDEEKVSDDVEEAIPDKGVLHRAFQSSEHSRSSLEEVLPANTDEGKEKKKRVWVPLVAAMVGLLGAGLVIRKPRDSSMYEIKAGDTLSEISRRTGKSSWQELVLLNPEIKNPDLIHPNERLRLRL